MSGQWQQPRAERESVSGGIWLTIVETKGKLYVFLLRPLLITIIISVSIAWSVYIEIASTLRFNICLFHMCRNVYAAMCTL